MQNEEMNMDNKLRQLENQSLPDLSKQDTHWQAMKQMLAPVAAPAKPAGKFGVWKWLVAAGVAVALIWLAGELFSADNKNRSTVTNTTKTEPVSTKEITTAKDTARITPIQDTIARPAEAPATNLTISIKPQLPPKHKKIASIAAPPCPKCNTDWLNDPLPDTTTTKQAAQQTANPKATLAAFFAQLEKPSQEFVVDNKRDTVIYGQDGTALLIPANTFNTNGKVTLVLKEYYSYEDIITNKLSTISNGQQLITGGMIHLVAMVDGDEVDITPSKSIRWFVPDTSVDNMREMSLFDGEFSNTNQEQFQLSDTATETLETLNWIPGYRVFINNYLVTDYKVLDLSNEPYKTRITKRGQIGKFHFSNNAKVSKEDLSKQMAEKFGYYKVKAEYKKRDRNGLRIFPRLFRGNYWDRYTNDVGDSAWVSKEIVRMYRLKPTDSATYLKTEYRVDGGGYQKRSFTNINLNHLAKKFSVDIRSLGWINCDRFYNDRRDKQNYFVNLKDSADNYYTVLVFDRIKSMVRGMTSGKQVIFNGVPKGEPARIICIGVQDGKTVAAMETLTASKTSLSNLQFEETTPSEFRQQAARMDNK